MRWPSVVMAEQLVGSVHEMDLDTKRCITISCHRVDRTRNNNQGAIGGRLQAWVQGYDARKALFSGGQVVGTAGSQTGSELGTGSLAHDLPTAAFSIARRCASGGAIWCFSPSWPSHSCHVAVEFVHPVIMGKRALPAVALQGPDLVSRMRLSCRSGDVLIAIASAGDRQVEAAMRRAPAWGVKTVWIGGGIRPPPGLADHVLWLDQSDTAPYDGSFVRVYHLLWELCQVCLEHPGLMTQPQVCDGPVCITCSDEGRIGEVVTHDADGLAKVRTADGLEDVETTLVGRVSPGDLVVVHAGAAITLIDEGSA